MVSFDPAYSYQASGTPEIGPFSNYNDVLLGLHDRLWKKSKQFEVVSPWWNYAWEVFCIVFWNSSNCLCSHDDHNTRGLEERYAQMTHALHG